MWGYDPGMTKSDLHRLLDELPDEAVNGAVVLLHAIQRRRIDPDQAWFWTPEWLAGELEADAEAGTGETELFQNEEEFLEALEGELKPLDP